MQSEPDPIARSPHAQLSCTMSWTEPRHFFQSEDYTLQRYDVGNVIDRRSLNLCEECLDSLRFKPFRDRFQTPKSAGGGL